MGWSKDRSKESKIARPALLHSISGNSETPDAQVPESRRPSGPETPSNPQDAETGGPTVESPCENERL